MKKSLLSIGCALFIALVLPVGAALADDGDGNGHGNGHGHHGGTTYQFKSQGAGTEKQTSPSGCQFTGSCTVVTDGTQTSTAGPYTFAGPYHQSLTIDYSKAYSNGLGGYCAPATGTSTLTDSATGSTLNFSVKGNVCEDGATATCTSHTFNGTYTITGGTGLFQGATGNGTVVGKDAGCSASSYTAQGTITTGKHLHGHGKGGGDDDNGNNDDNGNHGGDD